MSGLEAITAEQLRAEGFTLEVTQAFQATANQLDSIVMSRAPGQATEQLISGGHDLKGFFIKSKSCQWGPMAGLICQLPPLNKSGAGFIEFNHVMLLDYLDHYFYVVNPANRPPLLPWIPIRLTDSR